MRTEKTDRYLSMAPFIIPPLFHIDFTPYLAFFENCGVLQHYPKGATLMSFEEQTQTVQLLKSGIVLESSSNVNGLEKGVLCFPCYPIAFAAAIHQQPTVYSVSAYSNVTTVALPYSDYITLIQQHRELLEMSLRFAAFDSRSANATILQNFACSTTEKIYQTIFYYQLACQLQTIGIHQADAKSSCCLIRCAPHICCTRCEIFKRAAYHPIGEEKPAGIGFAAIRSLGLYKSFLNTVQAHSK